MSALIKKILFVLLISLVTLPAIAENTILVVGDSLSTAHGLATEQGWTALLQQRLHDNHYQYQVVNVSVTGAATSNGVALLPAALLKYHPAVTIIELGGNDGLRGLPLQVIKKNLDDMIVAAQAVNSQVLLLGVRLPPNLGPAYITAFQQIYVDLANKNHVSIVPLILKNIDEDKTLFQADGIHPIAKAEPVILDNIWPVLKGLL